MEKIDGNKSAFPFTWIDREGQACAETGLTIRQHFAAMAMQSILSYSKNPITTIADDAVKAADALITALNK